MEDILNSGGHEAELTEAELEQVSGGNNDFHFTKQMDSSSPNLFLGTSPAPPPPPPKKA